ncbi:MAG: hypothetical protein Q8S73_34480, partial [Deltaproteobacteria bacterium]|nr:hypothetical protein [Myxococcales bacterium]MDP3219257.1 hypothetical protein [Deltaproteobacteria bacterium]
MSAATSPTTGRPYGVTRVCAAWRVPRSSFSAERARRRALPTSTEVPATATTATVAPRRPRGPRPRLADERVLELTRGDLAGSPFHGEGHRKVCARLRRAGHPVFARQVLRVMRGAQLLSPHRARQGHVRAHDGRIVTDEPNVMWGTDGMRVETVAGWVWLFTAVEHWNGEVMGWHVTEKGDRFAALERLVQRPRIGAGPHARAAPQAARGFGSGGGGGVLRRVRGRPRAGRLRRAVSLRVRGR